MNEFDTSQNSNIEEEEFVLGISKWIDEAKRSVANSGAFSKKFMHEFHMVSCFFHIHQNILCDEVVESVYNPIWICFKAILLLLLGTALAAIFADPLVDAVDNFSIATSIPSFFMSFIAMPLATNSISASNSGTKKTRTLGDTEEFFRSSLPKNLLVQIRSGDDEQHALLGCVLGPCLRETISLELLS
ncbi:unnamed protein product [Musa textilis]